MAATDYSPPIGEIVLYQTEDGRTQLECRFIDDTLWLSQALMAELFQISVPTVNEHLKGIYADRELDPAATVRKFRMVRREGARRVGRDIEHYNLDAILAVGYRVRSPRGTQFRNWAAERLKRARRLKLNLSRVFEAGLNDAIRQHEREAWLRRNRAALDAYNAHVERDGVFSDGLRSF